MTKRQLVLDAFNNKEVDRIPVGFWFHFVEGDDFNRGLDDSEIIQKNINGHIKFYEEFDPDFIKIMSDGFFTYPNSAFKDLSKLESIKELTPLGANHPWIEKQVELVKHLTGHFENKILTFCNMFSPATFFKFLYNDDGNQVLSDLIKKDKKLTKNILDVIAEDLAVLTKRVITEGGADGIYLSVQNVQDDSVTKELYQEIIAPSELKVLEAANSVSENNILHICGYEGSRNDLSYYTDYDAKAYNWAVTIEGVSLTEGKALFGGKAVIGGFANGLDTLIHKGSKEEIEVYTEKIINEAGRTGVIVGADCTVSNYIEIDRLKWIRDKAASL